MYEDIVNSLRHCAENDCSPECPRAGIGKGCISGLKREAADAIEELAGFLQEAERDRDEYRERLDKANDAIEELNKALDAANDAHNEGFDVGYWAGRRDYEPKWIPVEERRAEFPCICCDANGNMPFIPQGIVTIKDDQGVWQIDAHLADPNLHQNRLKPVLGYQNRITNWMPLPPAPREES